MNYLHNLASVVLMVIMIIWMILSFTKRLNRKMTEEQQLLISLIISAIAVANLIYW